MINYINLLGKTEFFGNLPPETIGHILASDICHIRTFAPEAVIYASAAPIRHAGIILEGCVDIVHPSADGNDTIVSRLSPGDLFGESFACVDEPNYLSEIRSVGSSMVLFMSIKRLLEEEVCCPGCRRLLIENILKSLAQSNIRLNAKIQLLTQKSLREKLLAYFHMLAEQNGSAEFDLPFNREQLACFLASERSSVCRELGRLVREHIIRLDGRHVCLLTP